MSKTDDQTLYYFDPDVLRKAMELRHVDTFTLSRISHVCKATIERLLNVSVLREDWDSVSGLAAVLMRQPWLTAQEVYEVFERIEARRAAAA